MTNVVGLPRVNLGGKMSAVGVASRQRVPIERRN
jgi:hypothetical protein